MRSWGQNFRRFHVLILKILPTCTTDAMPLGQASSWVHHLHNNHKRLVDHIVVSMLYIWNAAQVIAKEEFFVTAIKSVVELFCSISMDHSILYETAQQLVSPVAALNHTEEEINYHVQKR